MFCHITQNWRGRPLLSREVVVNLIGNTTTATGLRIRAELDENSYEAGIKVSDQELAELALERDEFHGEWNYKLKFCSSVLASTNIRVLRKCAIVNKLVIVQRNKAIHASCVRI